MWSSSPSSRRRQVSAVRKPKLAPYKVPKRLHIDRRAAKILTEADPIAEDDAIMDTGAVASWLGVSPQFLEIGRSKGYGPSFIRISGRRIGYLRRDVREWLKNRTFASTSEYEQRFEAPRA